MGTLLDLASLVVVPSGYKAGTVYSVVPTDGAGDLTFTRALDTATRVDQNGLIEKVRTNIFPYGNALSSAGWNLTGATLTAGQTDPNGGTNAMRVQLAAAATNGIYYAAVTSAGLPLTRSVFIKAASAQSIVFEDPSGTGGITINLTTSYQRFSLSLLASGGGNYGIWFNNSNDNAAKDFTIAFVQIETGDIATPYIPTTTAAVSVGMLANVPRLDYTGGGCPKLLLEPQRTNLVTFSEQINNAAWTKGNATISANVSATIDPSGFNGADKLQEDSSTDSHFFGNDTASATTGQAVTFSVFLKAAERSFAAIRLYTGASSIFGYYNLANGTLGTIGAGATGTIVSYGNGWYRCSLTITMASSSVTLPYVFTSTGNGVNSYTGTTGHGIFCFGCQQEIGSYATSYIPTLGAAVTRSADAASKTGISALIGQTAGTLFAEFKADGINVSARIISVSDGTTANRIVLLNDGASIRVFVSNASVGQVDISFGTWLGSHKIAVAYANNDLVVFLDGVLVATDTSISVPACSAAQVGTFEDNINITPLGGGIKQALLFKTRLTNALLAQLTTI